MNTKKMAMMAVMAAIAYLLVYAVRIPVVPGLEFLSYEPKDAVIVMAGFMFDPMSTVLLSLVISLLEMVTISQTGIIGCVMNILSTCAFATTASVIYRKKRTIAGAVLGLAVGVAGTTAAMLLWNWLITPLYMGWPREQIEALLLPAFLPFNLLKAGLNMGLTLLLYKPLVKALRRLHLLEAQPSSPGSVKLGSYLLAAVILATCIGIILALR